MSVPVVGSGPAVEAVEAALADADRSARRVGPDAIAGELAVVVGRAGARGFGVADERARAVGAGWLAVELGGVGGRAVEGVEAAITHLGSAPCYDCLCRRVSAGLETDPDGDPKTGATAGTGTTVGGRETAASTERFAGAVAGREAVSRLRTDAASPAGRLVELPYTDRELLPVPGCDCGGGRDWTPRRDAVDRPVEASLSRAERALDPRVGPVAEVGEVESLPLPYYLARVADTSGFSDLRAATDAAGVDPDWDGAFMRALGEALERYAAGVSRRADPSPVDAPRIDHGAFVLPDAVAATDPDAWVAGERLADGEPVALPATRVFYPTDDAAITTGLGLGNAGTDALVAGLTEVVERDAAMLTWYSTATPLGLAVESDPFAALRRRARVEGLSLTPTLLTQDVDVPVVAVAAHREGAWPRFALGSAAAFDPVDAAVAAGCEAVQNWTELRGMGRGEAAEAEGAIGRFASLPRAVRPYVDPETTVPVDSVAGPVPDDPVAALVDRLVAVGLDAYAVRLTTRDLETIGFEAVRALVPAAQPLFVEEPYFGGRAERAPEAMGYEPRLARQHHPFP